MTGMPNTAIDIQSTKTNISLHRRSALSTDVPPEIVVLSRNWTVPVDDRITDVCEELEGIASHGVDCHESVRVHSCMI